MDQQEETTVVATVTHTRSADRCRTAQLLVLAGPGAGRRIVMKERVVLGRGDAATLAFEDEETVSRRHACVVPMPDGTWELEDLGSVNGTSVNGTPVRRTGLHFGDKIRLGPRVVVLFGRHDPLEDQLFEAQRLQLVGQLSARVAHDFNNVLTAIMANAYFAEEGPLRPGELEECLAAIRTATRRGASLAKQLTRFAAPDRERSCSTSVASVVSEVEQLLLRTLPSAVAIRTQVAPDVAVSCGASALMQVLLNLGVNAIDAMPDGGALSIEAHTLPEGEIRGRGGLATSGPCVHISVTDTGSGMDEQTKERLFEPFFTTKPPGKGTGLGLATVAKIVFDHDGLLDVVSTLGQGTRFDIYLPAARTLSVVPSQAPPRDATRLEGTVLLVDDDELVRDGIERILNRRGLCVRAVGTGADAIAACTTRDDRFDLVLLDLQLPDMRGEEVFDELLALDPSLRVLIVSGCADAARLEALDRIGVEGVVHKPFDVDVLVAAITRAMNLDQKVGVG